MKIMQDSEVFNFFRPIYKLSKCLYVTSDNLRPEIVSDIVQKRSQQIRLMFTSIILIVFMLMTYFTYGDLRHLHRQSDKILMLNLDRVALAMEAIVCYVIFNIMYHKRNELSRLLQILDDADKAIYVQLNERVCPGQQMYKTRKLFLYHMSFGSVLYFIDMCINMAQFGRIQLYNVTRLFMTLIRACVNFQYTTILIMSYWRMKHVNTYLSKMDVDCGLGTNKMNTIVPTINVNTVRELYRSSSDNYGKKLTQKSLDDIKMCRILHDAICDVCKDLDDMFGLFHLFCIVTTAVEQICEAFSIFLIMRDADYADVYTTMIKGILQLYFNLYINFYCVFYACDLIMKESSLTKEIIQRFHLESETNYLESELRVFSMQLKHSTLTFSAIEYFLLDWEMMIEINNDITSYFIFFVQYQINIDDKYRKLPELLSTLTSLLTSDSTSLSTLNYFDSTTDDTSIITSLSNVLSTTTNTLTSSTTF